MKEKKYKALFENLKGHKAQYDKIDKSKNRSITFYYTQDHIIVFPADIESFKIHIQLKTKVRSNLIKVAKYFGLAWQNKKVNKFYRDGFVMSRLLKFIIDDFLDQPEIIKILKNEDIDDDDYDFDISADPVLLKKLMKETNDDSFQGR